MPEKMRKDKLHRSDKPQVSVDPSGVWKKPVNAL